MSGVRIVLADDHALVRAGLVKLLESMPEVAVVGEASDGLQLLALVAERQPLSPMYLRELIRSRTQENRDD